MSETSVIRGRCFVPGCWCEAEAGRERVESRALAKSGPCRGEAHNQIAHPYLKPGPHEMWCRLCIKISRFTVPPIYRNPTP